MKLPDVLTADILSSIDLDLRAGMTPEQIAERWEVSRPTLVMRLLKAGKQIGLETTRHLEDVNAVDLATAA